MFLLVSLRSILYNQYKGYSYYNVKGAIMEDLFSIGELSKYQHISKQTLIYYDRIGLFRPAYVDPDNGYRYYSANQIDYLDTILLMKKVGFSLAEIRDHMQNYDTRRSLQLLRRQLTAIEAQIRELQLIRSRLAHRCAQIEQAGTQRRKEGEVTVELAEAQSLLVHPVAAPFRLQEISIATKQCFAQAFEQDLPIFFQCGVVVPLERIQAGRCTEASQAFVPIEGGGQLPNICRLPAGTCVTACHRGDYLSIGRTYEKILRFCRAQGLEILSDSYEFCINDYITTHDESEYITKILFYVRPRQDVKAAE